MGAVNLKKLVSILLIGTLLFYYAIPPKYDDDVYAADMDYYSILLEEVNNNGIYEEESGHSYGVVYAKVADFDKNGTNELYLVTLDDTTYKERLYSGSSIIYENELAGPGNGLVSDNSLAIAEGTKGVFIRYSSGYSTGGDDAGMMWLYPSYTSFYGLSNNSVKELLNTSVSEFGYDMESLQYAIEDGSISASNRAIELYQNWDGVELEYSGTDYFINDEVVGESSYNQAIEPYNSLEWEQIIYGSAGMNGVDVNSETIITNLLDQLIESAKPTNLGDDIKGTLDEELYSSLKKWISYSEHFSDYTLGTELDDRTLFQYMFMPDGGARALELEHVTETNASEFPPNTYSRHKANEVDEFLSVYLGQAFSDKETIIDDEYFPFIKKDGYYYYPDLAMGWNSLVAPYLKGVYKLADDIYYIDFAEYQLIDLLPDEFKGSAGELLDDVPDHLLMNYFSDEDRKSLYIEARGYAVMMVNVIDNEYNWTLIERNTQGATFDESVLDQFEKNPLAPATVKLNLEGISKVADVDGFVELIQEQINNKELNEQDKYILTSYLSVALQKLNQQMIDSKKNNITITKDQFGSSVESMNSLKKQFDASLQLEKLQLSKDLELINRVNVNYLNLEKPISVKMNDGLLAVLESDDLQNQKLYISFDGSTRGILIDYSDLKTLLEQHKNLTIILTYSDEGVNVEFKSENGELLDKIDVPIQILMPASSKFSTVSLGAELWGGQYNDTNSSLVFETKQQGQFDIQTKDIKINDLSKLNPEQQEAIQFLVARGLFDTEDGNFNSSGTISRYDFAKTLVRLFFVLDSEAVTSFSDIKEDSPYYKFVASGELNEIINGYEDGTFRGDTLIPVSHVLSFSGRTLANLKGYDYPAESEKYLQFMDANKVLEESRGEIALAVREGLIEQGGMLEPQRQITRLESAEILYKLYMLLYEEPNYMLSTTVKPPNSFIKENGIMIAGITIPLVAILAGVYFWRRKKTTSLSTNNTLESQK